MRETFQEYQALVPDPLPTMAHSRMLIESTEILVKLLGLAPVCPCRLALGNQRLPDRAQ